MSEIKPAMTPEEWKRYLRYGRDARSGMRSGFVRGGERDDAVAALALHGQEFGFTWADVDIVRSAFGCYDGCACARPCAGGDLAARIAALLPPREPFGFTWDDVDALRLAMRAIKVNWGRPSSSSVASIPLEATISVGPINVVPWLDDLADRIAALLPPREP